MKDLKSKSEDAIIILNKIGEQIGGNIGNMRVEVLMNEVFNGTVVLPDFQRSFIWRPEDVRELLVSVLGGYFIGSMLMLEVYRDDSPFALRYIEGVENVNKNVKMQSIVKILLDGQQRTSALFYALYEPNIALKDRKSSYKFYIDLNKALQKQFDEAVIAVNVKDIRRQIEIENEKMIIPFRQLKDLGELAKKFANDEKFNDIVEIAKNFLNYEISIVFLPRQTDPEKIAEIFERINRTGEPLSIFDLLTAKLYKDKIKLRDILERTKQNKENYKFIEFVAPEAILKVMALLRDKEPKRKNLLALESKRFEEDWERACNALKDAYTRITDLKHGYGVLDFRKWMPYSTMIVPLAAMIDFVKSKKLETRGNYNKIDCWYWVSVFSNRYDHAIDTTSANDFKSIKDWIVDDTKIPDFISKFKPDEVDLDTDKQISATYRGVMNLIVLEGALDFETGQPPQFKKEKIQDDHIFPKSIYQNDSVLNRTLILTNAEKSNKRPSEYFKKICDKIGEKRLKEILKSHIIPENALEDLLSDNIEGFLEKRKKAVINIIKRKTQL